MVKCEKVLGISHTGMVSINVGFVLPLDGIFLSSLLLVFLLQVGPVSLVPDTVVLSGDVGGILDHQAVVRS